MLVRRFCSLLAAALFLACGTTARAQEPAPEVSRFTWLPGDARVITRSTSASRDIALIEAVVYPRISVTMGLEFAFFRYKAGPVSLRPGLFGLLNLESRTKADHFFPAPGGDSDLWRGINAYEISCAFDRFAERYMGTRGALELTVGYYHESEHHSASNRIAKPGDGPDHPELRGLPQMNNWVWFDLAGRTVYRHWEFVLRANVRAFTNGEATKYQPFRWGIGGDFMVRSRHLQYVHPFWSTYAEALPTPLMKDANSLRSLLGVAFPGAWGELSVYLSLSTGAGKGLLIRKHETNFGGGLKYTPFKS